jgi:hypothetical protein
VVKQHPRWLAWKETGHVPFRIQSGHRVLNGFLPGVGRDADYVVKDIASRAPDRSADRVYRS